MGKYNGFEGKGVSIMWRNLLDNVIEFDIGNYLD